MIPLSLFLGCLFLVLGAVLLPGEKRGGYAVLISGEEVSDRVLLERLSLAEGGFSGRPVSESSQWVWLDVFGSLEQVPLDGYSRRVHSFDPRNDGYAEKLRSFFVRDGKRYVFIPLERGFSSTGALEKRFAAALGDISFSLEYLGFAPPLRVFFALFAAASLGALVFCYAKEKRPGALAVFASGLPLLASLAFFGSPGFALAALALGFPSLLREPLGEFFRLCRLPGIGSRERRLRFFRDVLEVHKARFFLAPLFPSAAAVLVVCTGLSPWFAVPVCILYSAPLVCSLWIFPRRFSPLPILIRPLPDFSFLTPALPFALAALLLVLFSPFLPGTPAGGSAPYRDGIITEEEYRQHLAFQSAFSRRPLGRSVSGSGVPYPAYTRGEDGLVMPAGSPAAPPSVPAGAAEFPLKGLMDFLGQGLKNSENLR
jgi:hypothetical protein